MAASRGSWEDLPKSGIGRFPLHHPSQDRILVMQWQHLARIAAGLGERSGGRANVILRGAAVVKPSIPDVINFAETSQGHRLKLASITIPERNRVTLRMRLQCVVLACATLAACDAQHSAQPNSVLALQRRIAEIAGQANGAAPSAIDSDTRLDGARAGPGLRLTVTYTLVNPESNGVDSATFEAKLAPTVKEGSCANSDLRPLIDQGVVVVLEYRGLQGNPIGMVNVNRETCGAPK
jgi:hypothetical protein